MGYFFFYVLLFVFAFLMAYIGSVHCVVEIPNSSRLLNVF